MESLSVIVNDEVPDSRFEFLVVLVFPNVDHLVFECAEKSLDCYVFDTSAFAVHRNGNIVIFEQLGILFTSVLAALVGIENFRCPMACEGIFQ